MALLSVGLPVKAFEGETGSYYLWNSNNLPLLSSAKVGAAKLVLQPKGFAFPHYSDCNKIGFVLQGSEEAKAGMISSTTMKETVIRLKQGDTFLVKAGSTSWWFNGSSNTVLQIIFLGDTSDAIIPGQFTYQYFSGTLGVLKSFSTEIISSAFNNLTPNETNQLVNTQTGMLMIKLGDEVDFAAAEVNHQNGIPEVLLEVPGGGFVTRFSSGEMCGVYMKMEAGAVYGPVYIGNVGSATQVIYVVKGKCKVEVVDVKGELVLSKEDVGDRHAFVVPKYCVVSMVAGEDGVECFSVMNCADPVLTQVSSVIKALCPEVFSAAFNLDPGFERVVVQKIANTSTSLITPPKK